jgi:hypothetical protein
MATERTRWPDERIDDVFGRIDHALDQILAEQRALRVSFDSLRNLLIQVSFGLIGVLIAALVALVIAVA